MEDPGRFYSRGAEEFAESHSIDEMPESYIQLMDTFLDRAPGEKVLDAGCGTGRDVQYFTNQRYEAEGIDIAEGMLEHARENKDGTYHKMDIRELEYEDEIFHGIWSNTSLIFFPPEEMQQALNEFNRVTREKASLHIGLKIGQGEFIREKYGGKVKQYLVTEDEAEKRLEKAGFTVVQKSITETEEGYSFGNFICKKR